MPKFRDSATPSSSSNSDDDGHEEYPMLTRNENPTYPTLSRYRRRQHIYLGVIILVIASTLLYFATSVFRPNVSEVVGEPTLDHDSSQPVSHPPVDLLHPSLYLNGPPTQSFRGTQLSKCFSKFSVLISFQKTCGPMLNTSPRGYRQAGVSFFYLTTSTLF